MDKNFPEAPGDSETTESPVADPIELEEVVLHGNVPSALASDALAKEYRHARLGQILGGALMLAGILLVILGATNAVNLDLVAGDLSAKVQTTSIGFVTVLLGLIIVLYSRPRFHYDARKQSRGN